MEFDPWRSGPATADGVAVPSAHDLPLPEHDSDLAPIKRAEKAGRAGKPSRKARRTGRRPEADRLSAAQAAATAPTGTPRRGASAPTGPRMSATGALAAATGPLTAATAAAVTATSSTSARRSPAQPDWASTDTTAPGRSAAPATRSRRATARRSRRHPAYLVIGAGALVIVAVVAFLARGLLAGSGPAHTISTPARLGAYALEPQLAQGMGAESLRADIVKKGNGEATRVVDAVYEISSGPAAKSGPLIVLFIGGNLSGSASSFISSFTGLLPGAFVTNPGALGGQAACVPGYSGHPAECAWADNDTFGLFASPTLSAAALGNELRSLRPLVERVRK